MQTTLSSKGQVVLPQQARRKLGLRTGTRFACKVASGSIILTPETAQVGLPRLVRDAKTGLTITQAPAKAPQVTSADVHAALADFP
ncbi:MAG: AbrB/MazE/SpoVT family DNA-binding domain-containing protein [Opitutaceae bacterium]|jgi:AbrB family looped-hinge helix DNA binding protein